MTSYYIVWEGANSQVLPAFNAVWHRGPRRQGKGQDLSYPTREEATKALIAFLKQEQDDLASLIRALQDDL